MCVRARGKPVTYTCVCVCVRLVPNGIVRRYISVLVNSAAVCILMLGDFEAILEANMVTYNLKLVLEFAAVLKLRQSEPDLPRPYRIPLETRGLCLLFAPPVGLTVALLVMASWTTLGIAACVVGLGLLAAQSFEGHKAGAADDAGTEAGSKGPTAEKGGEADSGCPRSMSSPKTLVGPVLAITFIVGMAMVMAQASTESTEAALHDDSASVAKCWTLEGSFCARMLETKGACLSAHGCHRVVEEDETHAAAGCVCTAVLATAAAADTNSAEGGTGGEGKESGGGAGFIDVVFLLASLGLCGFAVRAVGSPSRTVSPATSATTTTGATPRAAPPVVVVPPATTTSATENPTEAIYTGETDL